MFTVIYDANPTQPPDDSGELDPPVLEITEFDFHIGTDNRNYHYLRPEDKVIVLPDFERGVIRHPCDPRVHHPRHVVAEYRCHENSDTLVLIFFFERNNPTTKWIPYWDLLISHVRKDQVSELRRVCFADLAWYLPMFTTHVH